MARIGLLGGTFDPIHLGHLLIAEQCRERVQLDEVWFLPAYIPPHKQRKSIASFSDRAAMVELAIRRNPDFRLELSEGTRSGPSYTADTLADLHRRYRDCVFFFILGADGLNDLPNWHQPKEILAQCTLCVVSRPGFAEPSTITVAERLGIQPTEIRCVFVRTPQIDFSSREIRARIQQKQSIRYMVTDEVRQWIDSKKLYGALDSTFEATRDDREGESPE